MKVIIENKWCKGCLICVNACPKNVIEVSEIRNEKGYLMPDAVREQDCIGCLICEKMCPDTCIEIIKDGGQ